VRAPRKKSLRDRERISTAPETVKVRVDGDWRSEQAVGGVDVSMTRVAYT
jgi:hypothetical protein